MKFARRRTDDHRRHQPFPGMGASLPPDFRQRSDGNFSTDLQPHRLRRRRRRHRGDSRRPRIPRPHAQAQEEDFRRNRRVHDQSFKACSSCIFLKMNMYAKYIYVYICLIYIIIEKKTSYEIGASRIYTQPAPNAENCYSGWTHS